MIRCLAYAFNAIFKSRARLVAENLCLRQQLIVFKRRQARPQLRDADRRFWILAYQLFSGWSRSLIVVKPDTVVSWHRKGWKAYWRWRSRRTSRMGRRKIEAKIRELIRSMARENTLWGQRRIQAELARLGFEVCPRTVARYMRRPYIGTPSPGWRQFLNHPPRYSRTRTCAGHGSSKFEVAGPTNGRSLRDIEGTTTLPDSRPGWLLWRLIQSPSCIAWYQTDPHTGESAEGQCNRRTLGKEHP